MRLASREAIIVVERERGEGGSASATSGVETLEAGLLTERLRTRAARCSPQRILFERVRNYSISTILAPPTPFSSLTVFISSLSNFLNRILSSASFASLNLFSTSATILPAISASISVLTGEPGDASKAM